MATGPLLLARRQTRPLAGAGAWSMVGAIFFLVAACSNQEPPSPRVLFVSNATEGKWQATARSVELEHVQTIGDSLPPDVAPLSSIGGVVLGESGELFVLERSRMVAFDTAGGFLWQIPEGRGPGEIWRPRGFAAVAGNLVVANQSGTRIESYSMNGQLRASKPTEEIGHRRLSIRGALHDSLIVASSTGGSAFAGTVSVLSADDFSVVSAFKIDQGAGTEWPTSIRSVPAVSTYAGEIVVRHALRYELAFYSARGDTLRIVRRDVPQYTRLGVYARDGNVSAKVNSGLSAPQLTTAGRHLLYGFWPSSVLDPDGYLEGLITGSRDSAFGTHRTFDLYSPDWELLYSITPPAAGEHSITAVHASDTASGLFYAETEDELSILSAFRVVVDPPMRPSYHDLPSL
jgi:hypothetical protein